MRELALFAGAGGGILGGRLLGWRTVCAVERDAYCAAVLLRRQHEGHLAPFPVWPDARTFDGRPFRGVVDIVSAGFPCQPFSVAGKRRGADDERNGWPDTIRIIREVRPRFAFLENVPGLLNSGYFDTVLADLAESGFDAEWEVLGADDVGAPHRRKRLWILAHSRRSGAGDFGGSLATDRGRRARRDEYAFRQGDGEDGAIRADPTGPITQWWLSDPADVADGANAEPEWGRDGTGWRGSSEGDAGLRPCPGKWGLESRLGRVADGVACRVDRLRAIGNGQVPLVAAVAWDRLYRRLKGE